MTDLIRTPELDHALQVLLALSYNERTELSRRVEKEVQARNEAERKARREACPRQWRFYMTLINDNWNEVRQISGVVQLALRGEITNKEACKAAGYSNDELRGGSMVYLFNTCNGRFVGALGGGNVYIKGSASGRDQAASHPTYTAIEERYGHLQAAYGDEAFLQQLDITDIILAQPGFQVW